MKLRHVLQPKSIFNWLFTFLFLLLLVGKTNGQNVCAITGETNICSFRSEAILSLYELEINANSEEIMTAWTTTGGNITTQTPNSAGVFWNTIGVHLLIANVSDKNGTLIATCQLEVNVTEVPSIDWPYGPDGTKKFICLGGTKNFVINEVDIASNSLLWEVEGVESSISNPTGATTDITFLSTGGAVVYFTITDINSGCQRRFEYNATIFDSAPPSFEIIGADNLGDGQYMTCQNQNVVFNNTSTQTGSDYQWVITNGTEEWIYYDEDPFDFSFPSGGNYTVTLNQSINGSQGCTKSTVANIHVDTSPAVTIDCPSVICEGSTTTYSVNAQCSSYNWSVSPEGTIINTFDGGQSIEVLWSSAGENQMGLITFDGSTCNGDFCTATTYEMIPIVPTTAEIEGKSILCSGDNVVEIFSLPSIPGAQYNWTYEIDTSVPTTGFITLIPTTISNKLFLSFDNFSGLVQIESSIFNPIAGCTIEATHQIQVINNRIVDPGSVCVNIPLTISLENPTNQVVDWEVTLNGNIVYDDSNGSQISIPENVLNLPGNLRIRAEITGEDGQVCPFFEQVRVDQASTRPVNGPTEVCPGVPYDYSIISPFFSDTYTWTVTGGAIQVNNPGRVAIITWDEQVADHQLSVVRNQSFPPCSSEPTVLNITLIEEPEIEITGDPAPCSDGIAIYEASTSGAESYSWTSDSDIANITGRTTNRATINFSAVDEPTTIKLTLEAVVCGETTEATFDITLTPFELEIEVNDVCANVPVAFTSNVMNAQSFQWLINGNLVPAPEGNGPILTKPFTEPGNYCVTLRVVDPEGCVGTISEMAEITVSDNEIPTISPIAPLPCPIGTSYSRILRATPNSAGYNYVWFYKGEEVLNEPNSTLEISNGEEGSYYVVVTNNDGGCTAISETINIDYDCTMACDCPIDPEDDFTLSATAGYDSECGLINLQGNITPFENAISPFWTIVKPNLEIESIPITNEAGLNQLDYEVNGAGSYFIYLTARYQCADNPDVLCEKTTFTEIYFPFVTDFISDLNCDGTNNSDSPYAVTLTDMSSYFESADSVSYKWSTDFNEATSTTSSFTIDGLAPGISFEVCLEINSGNSEFNCVKCKTINVPGDPYASFLNNQMGLCENQSIRFVPDFPEFEILNLTWNFIDDNTTSNRYEFFKVYQTSGTKTVKLDYTTIYGCEVSIEETFEVNVNELGGNITSEMTACASTAILQFEPGNNSSVPVSYEWFPGGETTPEITVMESNVYSLIVTDEAGCQLTASSTEMLVAPFPGGITGNFVDCNSSEVTASINPTGNFTYEWTLSPDPLGNFPENGTTINLSGYPADEYTATLNAIGENNTSCATIEQTLVVLSAPDPLELTVDLNTCDPISYTITSNYENTVWSFPDIIEDLVAQTVYANQNDLFIATYSNEAGCTTIEQVVINSIVDFSVLPSGCNEYCKEILLESMPKIPGISGVFESWEWRLVNELGNLQVLSSGSGSIDPLILTPEMNGTITLWVDNGDCESESEEFNISIEDCPDVECDGFYAERICTTCSCGTPFGGARVFDSNGNSLDPEVYFVTWDVDGVIYDDVSRNPFSREYTGPSIYTAYISYTSLDGSIVCEEVVATEVYCHGDCPSYQFATCVDFPDHEVCLEAGVDGVCGESGGYVFVVDGAGNLVENTTIDWYNDSVTDSNPFRPLYFDGCATEVSVGIGVICEVAMLEYERDCCATTAPDLLCSENNNLQITWEGLCGAEAYEIDFTCPTDPWANIPSVIVSQPNESGVYVYQLPAEIECEQLVARVRGLCSSGNPGPWSNCVEILENEGGCNKHYDEVCYYFEYEQGEGDGKGKGKGEEGVKRYSNQTRKVVNPNESLLYPNPANGAEVFLQLSQDLLTKYETVAVRLLDVNGNHFNRSNYMVSTQPLSIGINDLAAGIYLISVYAENGDLLFMKRLTKIN